MRGKVLLAVFGLFLLTLLYTPPSDAGKAEQELVVSNPIDVECVVLAGKTVVKIVAYDELGTITVRSGSEVLWKLPKLHAGWSVSMAKDGTRQTLTVAYVWREKESTEAVVCR